MHLRVVKPDDTVSMSALTQEGEIISIPRTVNLLRHGLIDFSVHDDSRPYLYPLAENVTDRAAHPLFYEVSLLVEYDYDQADHRHCVLDEMGHPMAEWTISGSGSGMQTYLTIHVTSFQREVTKLAQIIQFPGRP